MIVNIKTKYQEGKIEAPERLLGLIAYFISRGADYLEAEGCVVLDKEARKISKQIIDALRDKQFFDNPVSGIISAICGEKIGGKR